MRGYLLDTNHIGAIARQEPKVMAKVNTIAPENLLRVCAITLGEIEAGNLLTATTNELKRSDFLSYVNENFLPYSLNVTATTRISYAKIIESILTKYPIISNKRTERHLVEIGVDINDVWIAAVAHDHRMVLVTHDNMEKIKEAIESELEFDDWL